MKKHRLLMLMFASAALLFASCGKENDFSGEEITLQVFTSSIIGERFKLTLSLNNNNPYFRAYYYEPGYLYSHYENDLFDVGTISSFSDISVIPSNWMHEVSVKVGHGYVCRALEGAHKYQYWKLYVKEIVKDAAGNILAVKCIVSEEWKI